MGVASERAGVPAHSRAAGPARPRAAALARPTGAAHHGAPDGPAASVENGQGEQKNTPKSTLYFKNFCSPSGSFPGLIRAYGKKAHSIGNSDKISAISALPNLAPMQPEKMKKLARPLSSPLAHIFFTPTVPAQPTQRPHKYTLIQFKHIFQY